MTQVLNDIPNNANIALARPWRSTNRAVNLGDTLDTGSFGFRASCPECGRSVTVNTYCREELILALEASIAIELNARCHFVRWDATERERERLRTLLK